MEQSKRKVATVKMHTASIILLVVVLVIHDGPKWLNAIANLIRVLHK